MNKPPSIEDAVKTTPNKCNDEGAADDNHRLDFMQQANTPSPATLYTQAMRCGLHTIRARICLACIYATLAERRSTMNDGKASEIQRVGRARIWQGAVASSAVLVYGQALGILGRVPPGLVWSPGGLQSARWVEDGVLSENLQRVRALSEIDMLLVGTEQATITDCSPFPGVTFVTVGCCGPWRS